MTLQELVENSPNIEILNSWLVTDNKLTSADKVGDAAVKYTEGKNNTIVSNGGVAVITIDVGNVFVGNNNTIAISVVNATGNVTVKVNNKEFKEVKKLKELRQMLYGSVYNQKGYWL